MLESKKGRARDARRIKPALEFKGSRLTLMMLHLYSTDARLLAEHLEKTVGQAPSLFQNAPVVLDLSGIREAGSALDWPALLELLRRHGITPLGVRGGGSQQRMQAAGVGLALLPDSKVERQSAPEAPEPAVETAADPVLAPVKIVTQPIRSGQQVVARQGDLVVLAMVSRGAEILAERHIYVYGPLRGRALAGVSGDISARIFCQHLDAELVAVAGQYQISEELDSRVIGKPAQIYLENDELKIETF